MVGREVTAESPPVDDPLRLAHGIHVSLLARRDVGQGEVPPQHSDAEPERATSPIPSVQRPGRG